MDVDIDFADRQKILDLVHHIPASTLQNGNLMKHVCGVYFQEMPIDPVTGLASIPADTAENRGWFKIDFLNLTVYQDVRDEEHLDELLAREPMWEFLEDESFVNQLIHLNGHYALLQVTKPRSIYELAVTLALRLPSKRHLVGQPKAILERDIWKPTSEYYFKKAHAIAYAHVVVVNMNLLVEKALTSD
jgi:hypothetical protein